MVAIVEGFLSDAYKEVVGCEPPRSIKALIKKIHDLAGEQNSTKWAYDALFLAEIRHAVVHNQGRVDEKFLEKVGAREYEGDGKTGNKRGRADEIWDKDIWPKLEAFLEDFKPPQSDGKPGEKQYSQVCVAIDKVIIPYAAKCCDFIDTSVKKFRCVAKKLASNRQGSTPASDNPKRPEC